MWYCYCRKSTTKQNETSFQVQEEFLRGQAQKLGETEVQVVTETGSGSSIEGRPEFKRILEESKTGDVIALYDSSRGFRNTEDALRTASVLSLKGVRLYISDKFINVNNPIDKMLFSISSSFDSYQREIQAKKAKKGQTKVFEEGNWLFCSTLFGYNLVRIGKNKTVSVIEEEAKIVRFVFEKFSSGWSVKKILQELQGLPLQRQSNFTLKKISRILHQPIYMGYYIKDRSKTDNISQMPRGELESKLIHSNIYPPIISEDLWWTCYERYREVPVKYARPWELRFTVHTLSGIIKCEKCGKGISRFTKRGGLYAVEDHTPDCPTKYRGKYDATWLEHLVETTFYLTFLDGSTVGAFFSERQQELYSDKTEIVQAISSIVNSNYQTQQKIDRLVDAISDGILSSSDAKKRMDSLKNEQKQLEEKRLSLEQDLRQVEVDIDAMLELSSEEVIDTFPNRKREYYKKFLQQALMYTDHIYIQYMNGREFVINKPRRHSNLIDDIIVTTTCKDDSFQFIYNLNGPKLIPSNVEVYDNFMSELLMKAWSLVTECDTILDR